MPSIFDVAKHFDDEQVYDAYTLAPLWKAQVSSFLEAAPDGSTAKRRTMSLAPGLAIPARQVIKLVEGNWVVGNGNTDSFYNQAIRQSFWLKKATDLFEILTPANAALAIAGVFAYGHRSYLKDTVNVISDSEYDPFWEIYFSTSETVQPGYFLKSGVDYYRVRSAKVAEEGMINAASDSLDAGARVAATFTRTSAYNPITDTYSAATVNTFGILFDRYKDYELKTEADRLNLAGDRTLVIGVSGVPVGAAATINSEAWKVLNVTPELDGWALHIRKA